MAYGVLYGNTGVNKIPLARTILPINNIVAGVGIVAGATANTFTCGELGLHQIDLDLQMSAPTNDTPFTLQLWNVTTNTLVQSRTGTAPMQQWASDMYFGFEWNNPNLTDEYAFYVIPNTGVALNGFCLLLQELNFRAVVQEFGGAGVGPGTVGTIPVFTGIGAIGDSIMDEVGATIVVAGAVSLAGANNATFLEFTDGQNVAVSLANQGRIRYNTALQTFQFSENTGAWADLSGVGPGTANRVAKFITPNTVGDSTIADTGVAVVQTQTAAAGANATAFTINAAAHTTVPTTVETIDVDFNLDRIVQHATGAIATQRAVVIRPPTYSFVGASTITDASTVAITGVPAAGVNCVITNAWALNVTGPTRIGGKLTVTGGIDPTFLELAGADTNTYLNMIDGKNVAVGAGGQGRMRYSITTQKFEFSENGAAYTTLPTATGTANIIPKCTNAVGPVYGNSTLTDTGTAIVQAQTVATSGSPTAWTLNAAAHTTLGATAQAVDVNFNLARTVEWAAGAIAIQRAFTISAPTYAFDGPSIITYAATFAVTDKPQTGANATLTNAYSIWAMAGRTQLDGGVNVTTATTNTITQGAATTGSPTGLTFTGGAHTTLTASAEAIDVNINLNRNVQFSTGDFGLQRAMVIQAPTYAFVGASTITEAATLAIRGDPIAGANCSITAAYALTVDGNMRTTQAAATTGSPTAILINGGAHTTLTATVEATDVNVNLARTVEFATGAIATQRAVRVLAPTYAFVGGSTITTAATLSVSGAPALGANASITNAYAFWVEAGRTQLAGGVNVTGATTNTITQLIATTGSPTGLTFTGAAHTTLTATAEAIDVNINLNRNVQFGTGAIALQRAFVIQAPTYTFVGASTITEAATLAIRGDPIAGANCIITNSYALTVDGNTRMTQAAATAGSPTALLVVGGAHTTLAATVEATDVNVNLARTVEFATGAIATQRAVRVQAPTYAFVAGSTITSAATVSIAGAPVQGLNATITNPYALWIEAGRAQFSGDVRVGVPSAIDGSVKLCNASGADIVNIAAYSNVQRSFNISGLDYALNDSGESDYWLSFGSRTNIIYGPEVDFLGGATDVTVTCPANCKVWVEEVGWIMTVLTLDGGALTVQPTIRAGITGTLAKLLAAQITTLLTAVGTRERYTTLLTDVGETTLTAGMTVAGTIAGGGAGIAYKGRPYWVVRVVENE